MRIVSAWRFFKVPTSIACELVEFVSRRLVYRSFFILQEGSSLIAQPVSKVHALDHGGGPFVSTDERDRLEHILNVAMAPVFALDG